MFEASNTIESIRRKREELKGNIFRWGNKYYPYTITIYEKEDGPNRRLSYGKIVYKGAPNKLDINRLEGDKIYAAITITGRFNPFHDTFKEVPGNVLIALIKTASRITSRNDMINEILYYFLEEMKKPAKDEN